MSHVPGTVTPVTESFALDHRVTLAAFQTEGDERFVWGLDTSTDQMFFLAEDQAHEQRAHVTEHVVCPVPGCAAPLTTVHSTVKRDHLRHLGHGGGHGLESFFHSQGCALIQHWLATKYPLCRVVREEYTNEAGERRADMLLTSPSGNERVAFEVQYSPLTHDAWTRRHESYRAQGIEDVWLFGHTEKQLKLDADERLKSNPALDAVFTTGAPVLFINPSTEQLAIATTVAPRFSWRDGWIEPADVAVLSRPEGAYVEVHELDDFLLGMTTLTSPRLEELKANATRLEAENAEQHRLGEVMAERARIAAANREAENAARLHRLNNAREEKVAAIRAALGDRSDWSSTHPAVALIESFLEGRPWRDLGEPQRREHWKCIAYFFHIAGNAGERFGPKEIASTLRKHGVRLEKGIYKTIAIWLHELVDLDFLYEGRDDDGYSIYKPTFNGTWW